MHVVYRHAGKTLIHVKIINFIWKNKKPRIVKTAETEQWLCMPLLLLRTTKESTHSQPVLLGPTVQASAYSNFPEMVLTQNSMVSLTKPSI